MKKDPPESPRVTSLLGLYLDQKEEFLSRLNPHRPTQVADQVGSFIRDMERPYTDASAGGGAVHLVHHVLNAVAAASQTLVTVEATASLGSAPPAGGGGDQPSVKFMGSARSTPLLFLWGITLACILAVIFILSNDPDPAILPIVSLIAIAILATAGATTSGSGRTPALTPRVTLHVDLSALDKKVSHALRVADELLDAAHLAYQTEEEKSDRPELEPKRTLELLQALASHRMTTHPEKEASDLAGEAIRILFNAKVTPVEYTRDKEHLFEQRPAGIKEYRTLLPALVNEHGELVCEGVVLVPVT